MGTSLGPDHLTAWSSITTQLAVSHRCRYSSSSASGAHGPLSRVVLRQVRTRVAQRFPSRHCLDKEDDSTPSPAALGWGTWPLRQLSRHLALLTARGRHLASHVHYPQFCFRPRVAMQRGTPLGRERRYTWKTAEGRSEASSPPAQDHQVGSASPEAGLGGTGGSEPEKSYYGEASGPRPLDLSMAGSFSSLDAPSQGTWGSTYYEGHGVAASVDLHSEHSDADIQAYQEARLSDGISPPWIERGGQRRRRFGVTSTTRWTKWMLTSASGHGGGNGPSSCRPCAHTSKAEGRGENARSQRPTLP